MVRFLVLLLTTTLIVIAAISSSDIFDSAAAMTAWVASFCLMVGLCTHLLREN